MTTDLRRATTADLDDLAPLFDAYRQFYGQAPDLDAARRFLAARLHAGDSTLLLARRGADGPALGFAQLYPSFSSVACRPILILNDLYVHAGGRGLGVGRALLEACRDAARAAGAARLVLETGDDNRRAQALYEAFGFRPASGFVAYTLPID